MRNGSSIASAAVTLLMFPLGSVISVHMMPKGSGLVSNRGAEKKEDKHVGEAGGELWLEHVGGTRSTTEKPKEKESNLVNIWF